MDCSMRYERELLIEITALIKAGDQEQLTWSSGVDKAISSGPFIASYMVKMTAAIKSVGSEKSDEELAGKLIV